MESEILDLVEALEVGIIGASNLIEACECYCLDIEESLGRNPCGYCETKRAIDTMRSAVRKGRRDVIRLFLDGGEWNDAVSGYSGVWHLAKTMKIKGSVELRWPLQAAKIRERVDMLQENLARKIDELSSTKREVERLSATGYACGAIEGVGVFKGGCGLNVNIENSYRCSDCSASFHRDCIRKHFSSHAERKKSGGQ